MFKIVLSESEIGLLVTESNAFFKEGEVTRERHQMLLTDKGEFGESGLPSKTQC